MRLSVVWLFKRFYIRKMEMRDTLGIKYRRDTRSGFLLECNCFMELWLLDESIYISKVQSVVHSLFGCLINRMRIREAENQSLSYCSFQNNYSFDSWFPSSKFIFLLVDTSGLLFILQSPNQEIDCVQIILDG